MRLDQYSRKDVMIMTGVEWTSGETQQELYNIVTGILNKATSKRLFSNNDFIAIHRNNTKKNNGRPPTITVKFIRFSDKDLFFNKTSRNVLAEQGIRVHHNLCPRMIAEQNLIKQHPGVKYVNYIGPSRHFSVKMNDDEFHNFIKSYKHFRVTLENEC